MTELPSRQVQVLDPERQTFQQAQSASIQQDTNESVHPGKLAQDQRHPAPGEFVWHTGRGTTPRDAAGEPERPVQDVLVQEQERAQRLSCVAAATWYCFTR